MTLEQKTQLPLFETSSWSHICQKSRGVMTCLMVCLDRNSTYCMKVSMSLTVEESEEGLCFSSRIRYQENAEVTKSKMISCPDIDDYLAPYKQPIMTWYKECQRKEWRSSIIINTTSLWVPEVQEDDGGNYTCELKYGSRVVRRTTELKVTGMRLVLDCRAFFGYSGDSRPIIYWMKGDKFVEELEGHIRESEVRYCVTSIKSNKLWSGMRLVLDCRAFFGYSGDSRPIIYWMKGDKFVEELEGHIRESEVRVVREFLGEKEVALSLIFDAVEETDMGNYTCNVENHIGRGSGSAILQKKDVYRLELVGGLGAIMLILGIFTAIYKCYNVEIMLCYRRHFGSDEADDDNKEYDAYLSYTKVDLESVECEMSEEELFALEILPDVLEKHYGYKLFIPHRDLIPSSTYIEDLARSVEQSRRLIIVLTPEFVARRGWSIFQFEPRLHSMLVTGEIKVIMIECSDLRSVINYQELEDLKHTIRVLSLIKWYGPKSSQLQSKFWKRVRYEMPAKRKESVSCRQVLDSGEQGLFGDLQAVSTVAMTATSASLVPAHVEIPDYNEPGHLQMHHFCRSYEYELPSSAIATLSGQHVYCNLPMTLLNGRPAHNDIGKPKKDIHLSSQFVPLSRPELSSDIW
ncbi:X-linked interleukin-1 receptor accessory protein-like 2 [Sinocyclocheilus grahami]|uniref:X-linked interleukin-1 receptor accessory protein-like 2 n=1 Tax=Sinocyclocheilus grahami TaxID=75366 RepID=UPI0007ACB24A|nr:PREDICTED: X-linked interleukin-1 receptor accessory protein-like 2 [Sinocyclocheilus grahami]